VPSRSRSETWLALQATWALWESWSLMGIVVADVTGATDARIALYAEKKKRTPSENTSFMMGKKGNTK